MKQIGNIAAPGASTDERASSLDPEPAAAPAAGSDWPDFDTREEAMAFWQGVRRGISESGRDRAHPHMPESFSLDLTRDGAAPSLTSAKLLDPWPHLPDDEISQGQTTHGPAEPRADRRDGFTPAAEQLFLRRLAETGVVADACRATGITRQAAYARRNSAAGRPFALAWDAAQLIARGPLGDDALSRARHGVIERIYRNGELVAERHRYDNRLTMAVLTRLDRLAEGHGENAPVIRAVAQEFDEFLERLPQGLAAAEAFVAARFPAPDDSGQAGPVEEPPGVHGARPPSGSEQALLARLDCFGRYGAGLPVEIDTGDLDPALMAEWTDDQFDRAEASGFLRMLPEHDWPEAARIPPRDGEGDHAEHGGGGSTDLADGMCQMRQLYYRYHPPKPPVSASREEDDFAGCSLWEEESGWRTDFPPPPGFDGFEEGEPGGDDYSRELAPEERRLVEAEEALAREEAAAELAEMEAARRRFFGLGGEGLDGEPADSGEG